MLTTLLYEIDELQNSHKFPKDDDVASGLYTFDNKIEGLKFGKISSGE